MRAFCDQVVYTDNLITIPAPLRGAFGVSLFCFENNYNSRPSARGIMEGIAIKRRSSYYNSRPSARGVILAKKLLISSGVLQVPPLREEHQRPSESCTEFLRLQLTPIKNGHRHPSWIERMPENYNSCPSARGISIVQGCCSIQTLQFSPLREGHLIKFKPLRGALALQLTHSCGRRKQIFDSLQKQQKSHQHRNLADDRPEEGIKFQRQIRTMYIGTSEEDDGAKEETNQFRVLFANAEKKKNAD